LLHLAIQLAIYDVMT